MIEKSLLSFIVLSTMTAILFMVFVSIEAGLVLGMIGILLAMLGMIWVV